MAAYQQEMMEDGETFGWPMLRAYHFVWLQHLEQGRATWNDEATWLKLCRALVWLSIAHPAPSPVLHPRPIHTGSHLSPQVHRSLECHSSISGPGLCCLQSGFVCKQCSPSSRLLCVLLLPSICPEALQTYTAVLQVKGSCKKWSEGVSSN